MSKTNKPGDSASVIGSATITEPPPAKQPAAAKKPAKAKREKAGRLPVDVHAARLGKVLELVNLAHGRRVRRGNAEHQAAATLHGWRDHQAATGEALSLTETDYLAALKAASRPPPGKQGLEPHRPALSPHSRLFPHKK